MPTLNTESLPAINKKVLGVTSLGALVPILYSHHLPLQLALLASATASVLFWSNAHDNTVWHYLDRACVFFFLSLLVLHSSVYTVVFNTPLICLFFALSGFYMHDPDIQLFCHLMFRMVFFWWTYAVMVETPTWLVFSGWNILYYVYVIYICWDDEHYMKLSYWTHCALLVFFIGVCVNPILFNTTSILFNLVFLNKYS